MLNDKGYSVEVYVVSASKQSLDFEENFQILPTHILLTEIKKKQDLPTNPKITCVIDALFGTGLSRPITGLYAQVVQYINTIPATKVAVDIPSGLFVNTQNNPSDATVYVDYTLTFQVPKPSFFWRENEKIVGLVHTVSIDLDKNYLKNVQPKNYLTTQDSVSKLLKSRSQFSHKGSFGHGLLIAGSYGKFGAAILASKAAVHSGIGLLTVYAPKIGFPILQTGVPEAIFEADRGEHFINHISEKQYHNAVAIGCGIGQEAATQKAIGNWLTTQPQKLIIDADALNILAKNKNRLSDIPNAILTPHPKEFARLFGDTPTHFQRIEKQRQASQEYKLFIILKGKHTTISTPNGKIYYNPTGNRGMATGGSGDVLTGILLGLLAQGYGYLDTCLLGVYIHGLAGDLSYQQHSFEGTTASTLTEYLGKAFQKIRITKQ